jgi:hypothetical protein
MSNDTHLTNLQTLAVEIDALNEQANIFANQAVIYAAKSGQKLLLAKAQCNHGQFKSWLDENCNLSYSTASKYMRLATARPELLNSNVPLTALLPSVTQMMELMTADESVNEVVTAKIEAGEDVTIKEIQRLKKEAADLKVKNESLQNDLMSKVQRLDEAEAKVRFQKLTVDAVEKQNTELRDRDQALIDAKVGEERAKLILENQDAIAQAKREADNAKAEIERLKKDQAKAIKDGVFSEIQKRKTEIDQLEYRVESLQKQTTDLSNARDLLEKENGIVKQHLESIGTIGEAIQDIKCALYLAEERGVIPVELINEWSALNYALSGVSKEFVAFCNRENHVINGDILISNLSDLGRTLDSEAIFS